MTLYQIKFTYMDGKHIIVSIDESKVDYLFRSLSENKIYWQDDELDGGFWLPLDKIRHIRFKRERDGQENIEGEESAS